MENQTPSHLVEVIIKHHEYLTNPKRAQRVLPRFLQILRLTLIEVAAKINSKFSRDAPSGKGRQPKLMKQILSATFFLVVTPAQVNSQQQQLTDAGMKFTSKSINRFGISQKIGTGTTIGGSLQNDQTDFSGGSSLSQLNIELNPLSTEGIVVRAGSSEDWKILVEMSMVNKQNSKYYEKLKDEKSFVSNDLINLVSQFATGKSSLSKATTSGEEKITQEGMIMLALLKANKNIDAPQFLNGNTIVKVEGNPVHVDLKEPYWDRGLQVSPVIVYSSETKGLTSDISSKNLKKTGNTRTQVEIVGFKLPFDQIATLPSGSLSVAASSSKNFLSYTVKEGETAEMIAVRFNTTIDKLKQLNNLASADQIAEGQQLKVEFDSSIASSLASDSVFPKSIKVNAGDSLIALANTLGFSLGQLINANPSIANANDDLAALGVSAVIIPQPTLMSIALRLGIEYEGLAKMNPTILDPYAPIEQSYSIILPGNWENKVNISTIPVLPKPDPFDKSFETSDYGAYSLVEVTYTIPRQLVPLFTNNLFDVFR